MSNTVPRPLQVDPDGTMDSRYHKKSDPLPDGPPGPPGPSIAILGTRASTGDLPGSGTPGDGYIIGQNLWVWHDIFLSWMNAGPVRGPKGDQGDTGPQGVPGAQGPAVPLAGNGVATTASRSDHDHDAQYSQLGHTHDAGAITSGELHIDRIPTIPLSETSGILGEAQVGPLPASKINSGELSMDRLPLGALLVGDGAASTAAKSDHRHMTGTSVALGTGTISSTASVSVGRNAESDQLSVAIGDNADARNGSLALGAASIGDDDSVVVGYNTSSLSKGVTIGSFASSVSGGVAAGYLAEAVGPNSVAIGRDSSVDGMHPRSIALGYGAETTASDQMFVATKELRIDGEVGHNSDAPTSIVLRRTDGTLVSIGVNNSNQIVVTPV